MWWVEQHLIGGWRLVSVHYATEAGAQRACDTLIKLNREGQQFRVVGV